MDPAGQRLRGPGPWRLNPPTAAALEGALLRPVAAAGAHRCANATVDSRHMGVGEGREVPADIEGLMTEIHLRYGMTRVLRNVHFVQFWHGEHVRRRPARHVFTVWVCLSGEVRIYAECCQAGHGLVLCRQMAAGYMFVTEPTDSVTISVPHRLRNSRSPVWLAAVFATRHFEPLPPPMYAVPGHVVLARSASMLCDCWPSDPQRRNVVFYLRLSGSMVRVTVPGAELEIECTSGFAPDHFSIDDECVCCQARPHVARTAVWPLTEICRGATVVLAPPLARDRAAGLLAEIRLASQRWVRVRAIRSGRGDMGPFPSVVWAAAFAAIRLFVEGTVPAFAACVENGRAAYGMVYVPPEEPRMDGLCVFPTPAEPAALFVRGEEVIAAGAAAAMIAAAERAANGEAGAVGGACGSPAAAGEAVSEAMETVAQDFEIEFDPDPEAPADAARADSDSDEDDESSGPESGDERARGEDDSDSSDSYSVFSSSDEDDEDDSWGDSDSGIEEDDDGVGQAIEEEEEEERQVLGAVAEMLGD